MGMCFFCFICLTNGLTDTTMMKKITRSPVVCNVKCCENLKNKEKSNVIHGILIGDLWQSEDKLTEVKVTRIAIACGGTPLIMIKSSEGKRETLRVEDFCEQYTFKSRYLRTN